MAITVYKSTDASAPTLNGTVGSLINVLDACLVNGYGSKSAAGWTKAFSGTNVAAYRQSTSGHPGHYIRIDDNGPGASGGRECRVRGFVTMSDVNTGTEPFPTTAQKTNGLFWRKSNTADSTARAWTVIADEGTFYIFFHHPGTSTPVDGVGELHYFGSFNSLVAGDTYNTLICGKSTENSASTEANGIKCSLGTSITLNANKFLSKRADGTLSQNWDYLGNSYVSASTSASVLARNTIPFIYPNLSNSGILFWQPLIVEDTPSSTNSTNKNIRGTMRGFFAPYNGLTGTATHDTFQSSGIDYMILLSELSSSGINNAPIIIQISGSW